MTRTINYDRIAGNGDTTNARDERICLRAARADADGVRLASDAGVADIDIIIARGQIYTGLIPQSDVVAAGGIGIERGVTAGRVVAAGGVGMERIITDGRVVAALTSAREARLLSTNAMMNKNAPGKNLLF